MILELDPKINKNMKIDIKSYQNLTKMDSKNFILTPISFTPIEITTTSLEKEKAGTKELEVLRQLFMSLNVLLKQWKEHYSKLNARGANDFIIKISVLCEMIIYLASLTGGKIVDSNHSVKKAIELSWIRIFTFHFVPIAKWRLLKKPVKSDKIEEFKNLRIKTMDTVSKINEIVKRVLTKIGDKSAEAIKNNPLVNCF